MQTGEYFEVHYIDPAYERCDGDVDQFERTIDLPTKRLAFSYARRNANKFAMDGYCQIRHYEWSGVRKDHPCSEHTQLEFWEIAYKDAKAIS